MRGKPERKSEWWRTGVRFECQECGKCCGFKGEAGYVYLSIVDRRRLAACLGLPTARFTKIHCARTDGFIHLRQEGSECHFLRDGACSVYEARPSQCRTWPFRPDVIRAKTWKREVAGFCPGVGRGRIWTEQEIQDRLDAQKENDKW